MVEKQPVVYIVDDDKGVRESLDYLMRSVGFAVQTFASARDFLSGILQDTAGCLVLDVRLPGLSGLDLQREMTKADLHIPIIFITEHGHIPMPLMSLKSGPVAF